MWMTTHIAFGTTIYDSIRHERKWLRWVLLVVGGFLSHWLLDSTAIYHFFTWDTWWDYFFVAWQGIGLLWLLWWCGWKQVLLGIIAWLTWDIEWPIIWALGGVDIVSVTTYQQGFFHKYLLSWSSTNIHFATPYTAVFECLLVAVFVWLSRPKMKRLQLPWKR